jgi:hypothetical protein
LVVLTMRGDGEVAGFEVHTAGAERSWPIDRGEDSVATYPPDLEPRPPVSAQLLRRIPFGKLADLARSRLGVMAGWRDEGFEVLGVDATQAAKLARSHSRRPGRRGRSDRFYAELAVAYEAWLAKGKPLRVLADDLYLSESGLRTALGKARERGMLTAAPRGRAGGQATDKAKRLVS